MLACTNCDDGENWLVYHNASLNDPSEREGLIETHNMRCLKCNSAGVVTLNLTNERTEVITEQGCVEWIPRSGESSDGPTVIGDAGIDDVHPHSAIGDGTESDDSQTD